jgi:predicted MFS family arabinose efflux permease
MLAFASVWTGLACLLLSLAMLMYRPLFNDVMLVIVLYFGVPGTFCLAGLVLWSHRKDRSDDPAVALQRRQCKVAIGLGLAAAAIVYALVILAQRVPVR